MNAHHIARESERIEENSRLSAHINYVLIPKIVHFIISGAFFDRRYLESHKACLIQNKFSNEAPLTLIGVLRLKERRIEIKP